MRKTKIIATLGPASSSDAAIRELIDAGVDVFRFNFSHGTHESHADAIARVRQAAARTDRIIALLQDLSGPKIRTGLSARAYPAAAGQRGSADSCGRGLRQASPAASPPLSICREWSGPATPCSSTMAVSSCGWRR